MHVDTHQETQKRQGHLALVRRHIQRTVARPKSTPLDAVPATSHSDKKISWLDFRSQQVATIYVPHRLGSLLVFGA
jgi:hypothetical protein